MWLDIPASLGSEQQDGPSKVRRVEAKALVAALKHMMDSDGGRNLTFGIITFYSAQVKALVAALAAEHMVSPSEDGAPEIAPPYRELRRDDGRTVERLRFGTVDAFQGMEFDVVFLSMVRSNSFSDDSEKARRRKYGHLMSPNRLCVAMSRQKRSLVVVGDPVMLRAPNAPLAIGPLVKFREICEVRDAASL
jgi:superfamily I DNA and/or RNA helicase